MQLFTALNVQCVTSCLLIYHGVEFHVLVNQMFWHCKLIAHIPLCFYSLIIYIILSLLLLSAYHAGLNDKLRSSVLDNWISSKIQVVVATVAFGYDCIYKLNLCFLFFFLLGVWVRGIHLFAPSS